MTPTRNRGKDDRWLALFLKFIEKLKIDSKELKSSLDGKGSSFDLYKSQEIFLENLAEGLENGQRTFICLKARQLGISTISLAIDIFWLAVHPGTIGVLVTDTEGNRENFRRIIHRYIESFPQGFLGSRFAIAKGKDNRNFIQFTNGSVLDFLVAGTRKKATWGEGRAYSFAHLTECSKYGDPKGLASFRETLASNHPDRLFIYESPLALNTPLPTPSGWTTMGEVEAGDFILDSGGNPCRVEGTSPIFLNRRCFRVEFSNGDHIIADADHLWRVEERRYYTNQQWKSKEIKTSELDIDKHFIALGNALNLSDVYLPIDPYLLGVWLGDGTTAEPRITAGDIDIDEMRSLLMERGHRLGVITKTPGRAGMFYVLGVRHEFLKLGLLGNKHIPTQYLRASEEQRRWLLAGLMDTDGSVHKTQYQCNFSSPLPSLIDDVSDLLSSLGIKFVRDVVPAKMRKFPGGNTSECKESFRLLFSEFYDRRVFNLSRKRLIQETPRNTVWRKSKWVKITSVAEVPSVPVKCVAIDNQSHLFLAGRTMIPTHNTANGMNHYRDLWINAGSDTITQRRFFVGWWGNKNNVINKDDARWNQFGGPPDADERQLIKVVAERHHVHITPEQLAWIRWRNSDQSVSMSDIEQNLPWIEEQAFVMSGFSYFQLRQVQKDIEFLTQRGNPEAIFKAARYYLGTDIFDSNMEWLDPEVDKAEDAELRVWADPVPGAKYLIGCDPAFGRNDWKDMHAISVWRGYADKLVQVAEYATYNCETRQAAWVLAHMASLYKDCIINLELGGGAGEAVMSEFNTLRDRLHSEVYEKKTSEFGWEEFAEGASWYLYHKPDSMGAGYMWNHVASGKNQFILLNQYRDSYGSRLLDVRSVKLLEQMTYVVQDGGSIGAPEGSGESCKDDRVFAAALANKAWLEWVRPAMIALGQTYEHVCKIEAGDENRTQEFVGRIVQQWFTRAEEREPEETPHDRFMQDRGFM